MPLLSLLAACLGALGYGFASVLEGLAARRANGLAVMIQPVFIVGIVCDILAWAASVVALQHLTVFTVQSILAASLAVTVIAAKFVLGTTLTRPKIISMLIIAAGLVLVIVSSGVERATRPPHGWTLVMIVACAALALALAVLYSRNPPIVLATIAGLAFSGSALAARGLHVPPEPWRMLAHPMPWLIVIFGIIGLVGYSRSLESGKVGVVTAVLWVVEVVVPGLIGMWILGDTVRPGWGMVKVAGLVLTLGGCVWLALADGGESSGDAPAKPEAVSPTA